MSQLCQPGNETPKGKQPGPKRHDGFGNNEDDGKTPKVKFITLHGLTSFEISTGDRPGGEG